MRKLITQGCLLIFGLVVFTQNAFGGAWTLPKHKVWGEYYFKWAWAKEEYTAERDRGRLGANARNWEWGMEPKIEFGVTDWFTLMFSVEYKEAKYKEYDRPVNWGPFRRKNNAVTNVKIGGRVRFIKEPVVLSGQVRLFLAPNYGVSHGDDPAWGNQPGFGQGENDLELRGLIAKKFDLPLFYEGWTLPCYVGAETGYRFRGGPVCNDIPFFVEGGFWLYKWLLIKSEVDGYWCHDGTGSIESEYAIWRIGPVFQVFGGDASITRKNMAFNIELQYGYLFWGRNTNATQEMIVKVATQF